MQLKYVCCNILLRIAQKQIKQIVQYYNIYKYILQSIYIIDIIKEKYFYKGVKKCRRKHKTGLQTNI